MTSFWQVGRHGFCLCSGMSKLFCAIERFQTFGISIILKRRILMQAKLDEKVAIIKTLAQLLAETYARKTGGEKTATKGGPKAPEPEQLPLEGGYDEVIRKLGQHLAEANKGGAVW